jgi:uncharacterized damage-inducible protein DinB
MALDDPTQLSSTRRDLVKARLGHTRRWLNSTLKRVTPDLLDWAPAEGMRTVGGQLVEIISVELSLVPHLKEGRQLSDPEIDAIIGDQQSLENLTGKLVEVRRGTLEYLDSLSEDELVEKVPSGDAWFGTLWLPSMPRAEHFLNIAEHEFYHVGQLISYLWARGDDPYKW